MTDIAEWLVAQYDVDERFARAAQGPAWVEGMEWAGPPGRRTGFAAYLVALPHDDVVDPLRCIGDEIARCASERDAAHIAHHDPAAILADLAAKRRIVERCQRGMRYPNEYDGEPYLAEEILELLALPYTDREGYDPAWAPA